MFTNHFIIMVVQNWVSGFDNLSTCCSVYACLGSSRSLRKATSRALLSGRSPLCSQLSPSSARRFSEGCTAGPRRKAA